VSGHRSATAIWRAVGLALAVGVGMSTLADSQPVIAQATRSFVSGVGDDAFPCSRTAPCKTFAGAISKTASGGEINVLDPGGYGTVTISKAITIRSDGPEGGITAAGTNAIIVQAGASDNVYLTGLDLEGAGTGLNGVRFLSGKSLTIEKTRINHFTQAGVDVQLGAAGELYVTASEIRNNGGAGVFVKSTAGEAQATITNTRLSNNTVGLNARDNARAVVKASTVAGNTTAGLQAQADTTDAELAVENTVITFNATGVVVGGGTGNRPALFGMSRATILGNDTSIARAASATVTSAGNNRLLVDPVSCTPRPQVRVQTAQNGAGQLRITVTAQSNATGGTNTIQQLQFGPASNGRIDVPNGPADSPGNVNQNQPANTTSVTFNVRRVAAGAFTIPFTVVDGCGNWKTFVGGGSAVP
jgi:hypothetical protein